MSMSINLPEDFTAAQSEQLVDGVIVTKKIVIRRAKVYFGKAVNSKRSGIKIVPIDGSNYQIAFTVSKKSDEDTVGAEIRITKDSFNNDPIAMVDDQYATQQLLEASLDSFIDALKVEDTSTTETTTNTIATTNNASTATTTDNASTVTSTTTTDNASTVTTDNASTVDNASTATADNSSTATKEVVKASAPVKKVKASKK